MKIGAAISDLRKERNISQKELAAYLHVSIGTISNYENGVRYPDLEKVCKLADFFDVSVDYLLGRCPRASKGNGSAGGEASAEQCS